MTLVDSAEGDAPSRYLADMDRDRQADDAAAVDHDEIADLLALLSEDVRLGAGKLSHDLEGLSSEVASLENAVLGLDEAAYTLVSHGAAQTAALPRLGVLRRLLDQQQRLVAAMLDQGNRPEAVAAAATEARQLGDRLITALSAVETAFAPEPSRTEALAKVIEVVALRRRAGQGFGERIDTARHRLQRFEARLLLALRSPEANDRRREPRLPVRIAARLNCGDRSWTGATVDLARGGVLVALETPFDRPPIGGCASLELAELGAFPARIVGLSAKGVHLAFTRLAPARRAVLDGRLEALVALDAPFLNLAKWAAREVEALFARAIAAGEITKAALFASPAALLLGPGNAAGAGEQTSLAAAARDFLGNRLAPLQAQIAAGHGETAYATCTDRHGYLPVVTAGPAAAGAADARSAAAMLSPENSGTLDESYGGASAARSRRPHLAFMPSPEIREIAVPITVEGRHWGAFRLGFRPSGGTTKHSAVTLSPPATIQ